MADQKLEKQYCKNFVNLLTKRVFSTYNFKFFGMCNQNQYTVVILPGMTISMIRIPLDDIKFVRLFTILYPHSSISYLFNFNDMEDVLGSILPSTTTRQIHNYILFKNGIKRVGFFTIFYAYFKILYRLNLWR